MATRPPGVINRSGPSLAEIEAIIRDRVDANRSAGIVVGVIDSAGTRVAAYGDAGPGQPALDAATVFEIGSVTKVFTATLLAEMTLRGEVSLAEPVADLLPPSLTVPTRKGRQITLLDLATHTSGLPRLPTNLVSEDPNDPLMNYTAAKLYEYLANYQLAHDIGSDYEYSNTGFGLLGHALSLRAGLSYEQLLRERILGPLAMTKTSTMLTDATRAVLALPHDDRGDVVPLSQFGALEASGAIYSNLTDMLAFAAANINPGDSPLHRAMRDAHQARRPAGGQQVGLGWHIRRPIDRELVWHSGETRGSRTFIGLDERAPRAVVVLSNSISKIEDIGFHLLDERNPLSEERTEIQLDPGFLQRYVGVYDLPTGTVTVTFTNGGLFATATGLGSAPLYAATRTDFFVKVIPIDISFATDAGDSVTGLVMRFAGKEAVGIKRMA